MIRPKAFRIQKHTRIDDGIGGAYLLWVDHMILDGYLDLISGTDNHSLQNAFTEQSTNILIIPTYVPGVTDAMRVVDWDGRWYSITAVDDPMAQQHHLEIYLKFGGVFSG